MFSVSPEFYDAIYKQMKNYEDEAAQVKAWIKHTCPSARTVLDVACGTGEHDKYLKGDFQVDGIDLNREFLELAQTKNPAGLYKVADMAAFDLGRQYDAVICLFSSIGYVVSEPRLLQALRCFAKHLSQSGVMLVEPWFTPGEWEPGPPRMMTVSEDDLKVCRMNVSEIRDGNRSFFRMHYLVGVPGSVSYLTEDHTLGLFTLEEMKRAFSAAGLATQYDEKGIFGRGLYIATRA